jgi:hypothetical protein
MPCALKDPGLLPGEGAAVVVLERLPPTDAGFASADAGFLSFPSCLPACSIPPPPPVSIIQPEVLPPAAVSGPDEEVGADPYASATAVLDQIARAVR